MKARHTGTLCAFLFCAALPAAAQIRPVTPPTPIRVEPIRVEPIREPIRIDPIREPIRIEPIREPIRVEPIREPVQPVVPGPGGGGGASVNPMRGIPAACIVYNSSQSVNCSSRYISYERLYQDVYSCTSGRCYADKFLGIGRAPMVVVYPEARAERYAEAAKFRTEMRAGVAAMAGDLRTRVSRGEGGLPSLAQVESLRERALKEIEDIDQPVDESQDQRLRRLGLGPATRNLAGYARS